jgi:hypothetical protein
VSTSSRIDYHRIRQRVSSMEEEDHLDTLPDLILPQYRLQTSQQAPPSSRPVSRAFRRGPPLSSSHDPSRRLQETHTSSPSGDDFIEDSDTEPDVASPDIFASDAYPPGSDTAVTSTWSSTIPNDDALAERRRRNREYRDLQLDMKELRTQQAWDEKEMKICGVKRKMYRIEDEREDEELRGDKKRRRV